ncbi:hypothetical protein WDU94_015138 [Cyamophila willieti]
MPNETICDRSWTYRKHLASWFLRSCLVYYSFLIYYNLVYVLCRLKCVNHSGIQHLDSEFLLCISIWNYITQIVFYFLINVNAIIQQFWIKDGVLLLEKFLEKSFLSIVFPLSLSVCSLFWYVYFIDRELIYPKEVEELMAPSWYNHTLHTFPVVIVLLHLILVEHKSDPFPMSTSMLIQCTLHIFYFMLLGLYRNVHGHWFYEFISFYTSTISSSIVSYLLYGLVLPMVFVWIGYTLHIEIQTRCPSLSSPR